MNLDSRLVLCPTAGTKCPYLNEQLLRRINSLRTVLSPSHKSASFQMPWTTPENRAYALLVHHFDWNFCSRIKQTRIAMFAARTQSRICHPMDPNGKRTVCGLRVSNVLHLKPSGEALHLVSKCPDDYRICRHCIRLSGRSTY